MSVSINSRIIVTVVEIRSKAWWMTCADIRCLGARAFTTASPKAELSDYLQVRRLGAYCRLNL